VCRWGADGVRGGWGAWWLGVWRAADLLVLREAQNGLEHSAVQDLLEELVRERAPGSGWGHGG
jgi:hypothetical protein